MQNELHQPSAFWKFFGEANVRMIQAEGMQNLKRTVANNYFNWLVTNPCSSQFRFALHHWRAKLDFSPLFSTMGDWSSLSGSGGRLKFNSRHRQVYRLYVGLLWAIMSRYDTRGTRFRVTEPEAGNPIRIRSGGRLITQDLAHSILECNLIADALGGATNRRIVEVGAGYGRLAHVCTEVLGGQYVIVDIEPAISISHFYLTEVFGPRAVKRVANFAEAGDARIVILNAEKVASLPDQYFDVAVSISTLPELSAAQAAFYLAEFQRLSRSTIFLKQWDDWQNPADGTQLCSRDYKLGDEWSLVVDRPDLLVPCFFNKVWQRTKG